MATGEPFYREPDPFERPVFAQGLKGVFGTGGREPACGGKKRRNAHLIKTHQALEQHIEEGTYSIHGADVFEKLL